MWKSEFNLSLGVGFLLYGLTAGITVVMQKSHFLKKTCPISIFAFFWHLGGVGDGGEDGIDARDIRRDSSE